MLPRVGRSSTAVPAEGQSKVLQMNKNLLPELCRCHQPGSAELSTSSQPGQPALIEAEVPSEELSLCGGHRLQSANVLYAELLHEPGVVNVTPKFGILWRGRWM